ncbi:MAG: biotin/lipoyl-binding protein, partial [Gemmatimonadota bacterium]
MVALVLAVILAACTGDEPTRVDTAEVGRDSVVQSVAAAAVLEPADRVTVAAPSAGEVVELTVEDGDRVRAGDPLMVLRSPSLEGQLEQAEAALEATSVLGSAAGLTGGLDPTLVSGLTGASAGGGGGGLTAGLDLAPLIGALRAQLQQSNATIASLQTRLRSTDEVCGSGAKKDSRKSSGATPPRADGGASMERPSLAGASSRAQGSPARGANAQPNVGSKQKGAYDPQPTFLPSSGRANLTISPA